MLGERFRLTGKAMIHSSRRERKTKAIAEVLAMIADAHPELVRGRPRPRKTDEWLRESATDFAPHWIAMPSTLWRMDALPAAPAFPHGRGVIHLSAPACRGAREGRRRTKAPAACGSRGTFGARLRA